MVISVYYKTLKRTTEGAAGGTNPFGLDPFPYPWTHLTQQKISLQICVSDHQSTSPRSHCLYTNDEVTSVQEAGCGVYIQDCVCKCVHVCVPVCEDGGAWEAPRSM